VYIVISKYTKMNIQIVWQIWMLYPGFDTVSILKYHAAIRADFYSGSFNRRWI